MSRHRKIQLSRSKAILVAAGALSVATAASATTATWTAAAAGQPGTTRASAVSGQETTFSAPGTSEVLRLTAANQPAPPTAANQPAPPTATPTPPTATPTPTPTPTPTAPADSPQQIAQGLLGSFGWSASQFSCLNPLWEHESGWRVSAYNASSGAYGIPQALPGSKMASAGPDWQNDATTQIKWGLEYIKGTYGSPCAAYDHEQATGWY